VRYVQADGGIWRISERNYKRLFYDIRAGRDVILDKYGKCIITHWVDLSDLQSCLDINGEGHE
jgi:hypothetical protein